MAFVLVHSPLLGPGSWEPVARELRGRGHVVVVPDLRPSLAEDVIWQAQAEAVAASIRDAPDRTYWIVAHSGAGPLLPAVRVRLDGPPAGYMFVDAAMPHPRRSRYEALPQDFAVRVRALEAEGVLPPWHQWFEEDRIAAMIPDTAARQEFTADIPSVPVRLFEEALPEGRGWPNAPCCYLRLSAAYVEESVKAVSMGCRIGIYDGHHISMVSDPEGVTEAMLRLAGPVRG